MHELKVPHGYATHAYMYIEDNFSWLHTDVYDPFRTFLFGSSEQNGFGSGGGFLQESDVLINASYSAIC